MSGASTAAPPQQRPGPRVHGGQEVRRPPSAFTDAYEDVGIATCCALETTQPINLVMMTHAGSGCKASCWQTSLRFTQSGSGSRPEEGHLFMEWRGQPYNQGACPQPPAEEETRVQGVRLRRRWPRDAVSVALLPHCGAGGASARKGKREETHSGTDLSKGRRLRLLRTLSQ